MKSLDIRVASMKEEIREQIRRYFGAEISKMTLLGITKYAVATYVLRVQGGWPKESAIQALLQGRNVDTDQIRFVRSVLERLPSAAAKTFSAGSAG